MKTAPAPGRTVVTANEAAALGVLLAHVQAIACYPITPQTLIVERLAELYAGREDAEFANLESEHSMFGYAIAAARTGIRAFTATSSQGLLYAHEQLHRASRERVPLVAVNVNRSIFAPWSLEPDLSDSLSQRDTGWIQVYCTSAQEVLDSILCAYRLAESVLLPVLVNLEGFLLSHTSEVVDIPAQEDVDRFLPPFDPPAEWLVDPAEPRVFSGLPQPREYDAFQRNVADALTEARERVVGVAAEFEAIFGRRKVAALEVSGDPEAETVLVSMGTIGDTARELLGDGGVRLVRVHVYRPFPGRELAAALAGAKHVVVVDRAAPFGALAPLGADVRALGVDATDVVCGVGGTDVTPDTLRRALAEARTTSARAEPVWLGEET
jgi:pyruvate/2-oxoacid:ferredoxin oxidoreductase alpha subunit